MATHSTRTRRDPSKPGAGKRRPTGSKQAMSMAEFQARVRESLGMKTAPAALAGKKV